MRTHLDAALAHISNALDDLQYNPDQRPVPLLVEAMAQIHASKVVSGDGPDAAGLDLTMNSSRHGITIAVRCLSVRRTPEDQQRARAAMYAAVTAAGSQLAGIVESANDPDPDPAPINAVDAQWTASEMAAAQRQGIADRKDAYRKRWSISRFFK